MFKRMDFMLVFLPQLERKEGKDRPVLKYNSKVSHVYIPIAVC